MKAVERFDPAKGGKLSTYARVVNQTGSIKRASAKPIENNSGACALVDKISKYAAAFRCR